MSIAINYEKITLTDKFIMLEELWENMSNNADNNGFTPEWHKTTLQTREEELAQGTLTFSDFEEAKKRLQKLI